MGANASELKASAEAAINSEGSPTVAVTTVGNLADVTARQIPLNSSWLIASSAGGTYKTAADLKAQVDKNKLVSWLNNTANNTQAKNNKYVLDGNETNAAVAVSAP